MNKQIVRQFQAYKSTLASLRIRIRQMGSVEIRKPCRQISKTTRREDIDKVTSFRRNRFLSRARIPGFARNATGTRNLFQNSSKTTEGCASALTSPIRWCSVKCLHKRVRLKWTTTYCRCILDDIRMKLFSRKTSEMARHFFN